ncbi:MAG: hypothetical protein M1823_006162 [Watsoniomyces obsoletus]|nr:MAG: hypothetical protein M1823_006162 [Watsoniomyces obsoletus]
MPRGLQVAPAPTLPKTPRRKVVARKAGLGKPPIPHKGVKPVKKTPGVRLPARKFHPRTGMVRKPEGYRRTIVRDRSSYAFTGVGVLREIRRLQKTTQLLIPREPFARLAREIAQCEWAKGFGGQVDLRMTKGALEALQEAAEARLVGEYTCIAFLNPSCDWL